MVTEGLLTAGHARSLIDVENNIKLAKVIINKNLSVRQSELLSKKINKPAVNLKIKSIDPNVKDLQNDLELKIGMKVSIDYKKNNTGRISFEYKNLDQLNKFIANVKSRY